MASTCRPASIRRSSQPLAIDTRVEGKRKDDGPFRFSKNLPSELVPSNERIYFYLSCPMHRWNLPRDGTRNVTYLETSYLPSSPAFHLSLSRVSPYHLLRSLLPLPSPSPVHWSSPAAFPRYPVFVIRTAYLEYPRCADSWKQPTPHDALYALVRGDGWKVNHLSKWTSKRTEGTASWRVDHRGKRKGVGLTKGLDSTKEMLTRVASVS